MTTILTIQTYPKKYIFFALLSIALFRIPLFFTKKISFYKLMGSGKNGTFDKNPDWQQWAIFIVFKENDLDKIEDINIVQHVYGKAIKKWFSIFNVHTKHILLDPLEGHGKWDGKDPFELNKNTNSHDGQIAVLTRATIRLSKLKAFWSNVNGVADSMKQADGLIYSIGIGEIPFIKQATFSIWKNKEQMKQFAYSMKTHRDVIQKTRRDNWYKEELFFRFEIIKIIEN
ncbi:MAG: spheroidene monooxygenase [Bacteroidota bacterium]